MADATISGTFAAERSKDIGPMKLSELSELHLAAVVAGATFLGSIGSSLLGVFLVDARTDRQTDVQLVQLAIGILSNTQPADAESPSTALREWAVETINAAAEVQFDERARQLLIDGQLNLDLLISPADLEEIRKMLEQTKEPGLGPWDTLPEP